MQSINLISEEIAKIKIKNNVCIDFDYTDNSFGTARFYLFKTNTGERKCIRLFGYTEPNSGATINNTKFYYDAEGYFYVQCPNSTGLVIRAVACRYLSLPFEKVDIDTSTLTKLEQTIYRGLDLSSYK